MICGEPRAGGAASSSLDPRRSTTTGSLRGDAAALCRDVAAAGMYSLRKGALVGSYAEV